MSKNNQQPQQNTSEDESERQVMPDNGTLALVSRAELDQQITTAKKYPRSIKQFLAEARSMVTLNEEVAESCMYALPRKDKNIEGASARFAEMIVNAWGNCRAGARVVAEERDYVVAQGVFHDLEKNVAITFEVKRRIVDKYGRRYDVDMIGVTGNAACAIALRNSVLKGIPKAFWNPLYHEARQVAVGTVETLVNKRAAMLEYFQKLGVTPAMILAKMERAGIEDIGLDDLAVLKGVAATIKEGETTPEKAFEVERPAEQNKGGVAGIKEALGTKPAAQSDAKTDETKLETTAGVAKLADLLDRAKQADTMLVLGQILNELSGLTSAEKKQVRDACEARAVELDKIKREHQQA